jgi:hypothetical protein
MGMWQARGHFGERVDPPREVRSREMSDEVVESSAREPGGHQCRSPVLPKLAAELPWIILLALSRGCDVMRFDEPSYWLRNNRLGVRVPSRVSKAVHSRGLLR